MFVVSKEVYERLMHPEKKDLPPLKPEERIARDSFTGEKMNLISPEEFFKKKPRKKSRTGTRPPSVTEFFS